MKNLTPATQLAFIVALLLSIVCPSQASAGETELASEYSKKIQAAQVVTTLGPNLAGDSTNLYTGATSFHIVDVSLPGAGPAVAIGRSYVVEEDNQAAKAGTVDAVRKRLFGDWDLDVPSLGGVYSSQQGWDIDSTTPTKRCTVLSQTRVDFNGQTQPAAGYPRMYPVAFPQWFPSEFWSGITLSIPGSGS